MLKCFFGYHCFRPVDLLQKISNLRNSDWITLLVSLPGFPGMNSPPTIFLKPRQGHASTNLFQGSFLGPESRWGILSSLGASLMMPQSDSLGFISNISPFQTFPIF